MGLGGTRPQVPGGRDWPDRSLPWLRTSRGWVRPSQGGAHSGSQSIFIVGARKSFITNSGWDVGWVTRSTIPVTSLVPCQKQGSWVKPNRRERGKFVQVRCGVLVFWGFGLEFLLGRDNQFREDHRLLSLVLSLPEFFCLFTPVCHPIFQRTLDSV